MMAAYAAAAMKPYATRRPGLSADVAPLTLALSLTSPGGEWIT